MRTAQDPASMEPCKRLTPGERTPAHSFARAGANRAKWPSQPRLAGATEADRTEVIVQTRRVEESNNRKRTGFRAAAVGAATQQRTRFETLAGAVQALSVAGRASARTPTAATMREWHPIRHPL